MIRDIVKRSLTINYLSDDMVRCAKENGYKLPCVSIKQHYGKEAVFVENYKDGIISDYELHIYGDSQKAEAIYFIEK